MLAGEPAPSLPPGALYLIDTLGYVFRAFHALPPLTNSRGQPTAAVLGFTNMLRKLLQEVQPERVAAVFDLGAPTVRESAFADYKANRPPMPEPLGRQLPYIRRVIEAFRIPILEMAGYEADDVIATMCRQAAARGEAVVVVTGDKDLMQLVGDGIQVYNPSQNRLYDAAAVEAHYGVKPAQVADLLALRGDDVDNIPGAPGIGDKGARQLVQRFGSVEAALERAAEVERKTYRESLQRHADQIRLSKRLAQLHADLPVEIAPSALMRQPPDSLACRELFHELEFHALLAAHGGAPAAVAAAAPPAPEVRELDDAGLAAWLAAHRGARLALAFEPAAEPGFDLGQGVAGLAAAGEAEALQLGAAQLAALAPRLADPAQGWDWLDAKAVRAALRRAGLPTPALAADRVSDLTLLGFLHDATQLSETLPGLIRRQWGHDARPASAAAAAAWIARLAATLRPAVEAQGQWPCYRDLDLPLIPVLEAMEGAGVRLNPAPLAALSHELERRCGELQARIFALAGLSFNLNSPKQLAEVLFTRLGLPQPRRRGKTAAPSTAAGVLEGLAAEHEIVRLLLDYRQIAKLKSTYVDALPPLIAADARVHTTFTIAGSVTGRLASSSPNLQNIPIRSEDGRGIRAAFEAAPGCRLLSADYSQIELRLLAHFSQDPLLLEAFREDRDIHALTAAEVFGLAPGDVGAEHRRRAKAVNFGIVYGLSAFGLAQQLNIPQAEAALFIRRYFERYAGVQGWIEATLEQARRDGRVRTLLGRIRPIPNLDERNPTLRGFAERTAINTPLQGTAADLIKLAMIRLHEQLGSRPTARMLLQVHDELLFEAPTAEIPALAALVRREMEGVAALSVPLAVELAAGPNWRDLEPL